MPAPLTRSFAVAAAVLTIVFGVLIATGALEWMSGLAALTLLVAGSAVLAGRGQRATAALVTEATSRQARVSAGREAVLEGRILGEQDLVQRLPDPLLTLDATGRVRRMNAAADAIFGPGVAAVLRHPGLRTALDRAQATGQEQTSELHLAVPVAREVAATAIPLDPPLADGSRCVVVLSDRTRERAVERMRADFVANASHELRTPLTSLIGFIDTLRGPAADDPPAQARFLAIMAEQAERMNRLIDDLLSLSRIEITEHQPPGASVELAPLLARARAAFEPQLAARQASLDLALATPAPVVLGDADQLDQVLHNLLDNAIKYGRPGGIIRLEAARVPPGGRWPARDGALLTVTDDGPGVSRAHIPRLTERFYRADKHRSRAVGGTGLGLAIVKHIVNRHRGQLTIDSTEGAGTTVTIWLPAPPELSAPGPAADTAATGTASAASPAAPPGS